MRCFICWDSLLVFRSLDVWRVYQLQIRDWRGKPVLCSVCVKTFKSRGDGSFFSINKGSNYCKNTGFDRLFQLLRTSNPLFFSSCFRSSTENQKAKRATITSSSAAFAPEWLNNNLIKVWTVWFQLNKVLLQFFFKNTSYFVLNIPCSICWFRVEKTHLCILWWLYWK